MDKTVQLLMRLPLRADEVWQGGLAPMHGWVTGEGTEPYRPLVALWVARRAEKVHLGELVRPEDDDPAAAIDALLAFALDSEIGGYRPGCVEVTDVALAEALGKLLSGAGITVRLVDRLDLVEGVLDELAQSLAGAAEPLPGALEGPGVTLEALRAFGEAAAAFYRSAPWQYLSDVDLIQVESPAAPPGMQYCTVLGAGGMVFGLTFYRSADDLFAFYRAGREGDLHRLKEIEVWQVSFCPLEELPLRDTELWQEHEFSVADRSAYPLFLRIAGDRPPVRAGATELQFVEAILQALATTTEAEIDAGRWSKKVRSAQGVSHVSLVIPDLIAPPSGAQWIERGLEPDRRAHERMFADMDRYFRAHPPSSIEEMNAVLARQFSGSTADDPVTKPSLPLEQAQDLCYQAFDTFGRRRVQLARQALVISAECADAHVILAEQAGTREAELEHYREGLAAGKRALGDQEFEDSVGSFWGITATRPYMRSLFGLAETLEHLGRTAEAVEQLQELLRLNPQDNQGARYLLLPQLMALGRDEEAARLLKAYAEESANWAYSRALLAFRLSGRSVAAERELREAMRCNPHLPPLLVDDSLPVPDHYGPGGLDEAIIAAEALRPAYQACPGAVDWALSIHRQWQADQDKKQRALRQKARDKTKKRKRK